LIRKVSAFLLFVILLKIWSFPVYSKTDNEIINPDYSATYVEDASKGVTKSDLEQMAAFEILMGYGDGDMQLQ